MLIRLDLSRTAVTDEASPNWPVSELRDLRLGEQLNDISRVLQSPKLERLNLWDNDQYHFDLRGEFEIVEAAAYLGIAHHRQVCGHLASTHPEIHYRPVVRSPFQAVVKPELVASPTRDGSARSARSRFELASEEVNFSPRSNPSLKHGVSLAMAPKKKGGLGLRPLLRPSRGR